MSRRRPRCAPFLLLAAIGCGGPGEPAGEAPHLVLALADALRRDHLGVYGYGRPTSPFLDRLARQGVVFDDALAQGSETFVSTSTLLTSRLFPLLGEPPGLPAGAGFDAATRDRHSWVPLLRRENLTLAEVLAGAGYDTFGAFSNPHHHSASGFWQGFGATRFLPPPPGRKTAYARGPKVVRAFLDWLDGRSDRDTPVFAYLHFMDSHNPYRPPRGIRRQFVAGGGRDLYRNGPPRETPTAADLEVMRGLYDGEIRWLDGVLAALVEALEERGLWRRTVLVVASDHGDELMEHGGLGHGTTLEPEVLRVPLLVAGPALATAGVAPRRVARLVRNLDVAPTLTELAGLRPPAAFEGSSLVPHMRGEVAAGAPPSFARRVPRRSVTTERWHFSLDLETGERRLYDRRSDPGGRVNVVADYPRAAARLSALLGEMEDAKRRAEAEAAGLEPEERPAELDAAVREQLEALGYLE